MRNKATRLNRYMMFGTLLLGILVLGCVFAFLYLAYNSPTLGGQQKEMPQTNTSDSLILLVNDSTLLMLWADSVEFEWTLKESDEKEQIEPVS